jgi:DNA-binding CsgD family transcriptional regulator
VRLSRSDLEGALDFVREAGDLSVAEPFPPDVLVLLARLVGCAASYCETDRVRGELVYYADCYAGTQREGDQEAYLATVNEHPIRRYRTLTGEMGAFKIYDFTTARELRRTQFYNDFLRHSDTPRGFLMTVSLPAPRGWTRTLLLDREAADFDERDRTLLDLLRPHLALLRRATGARRRTRPTIQGVPDGLLSERETEVLFHLAEGMRDREIAQVLWIAPGTVHKHLNNIYTKLGVHTRAAAAARFRQDGSSV